MLKVLGRLTCIVLSAAMAKYLVFHQINDTWFYYLFSSIFQGLSALLGLLLASFVFLRSSVEKLEDVIPVEHLSKNLKWVVTETGLSLFASIIGIWLTPLFITLTSPAQLMITAFILGLAVIALFDIVLFMITSIDLDVGITKILNGDQKK